MLGLKALGRSLSATKVAGPSLIGGVAVAMGVGSLWAVLLLLLEDVRDQDVALLVFIDAPTLVVSYGVPVLAAFQTGRFRTVAAATLGLSILNLVGQLRTFTPGQDEPDLGVFAMSGLSMVAGVAIWLAVGGAGVRRQGGVAGAAPVPVLQGNLEP
jgi:hypothetical protein